MARFGRAAKIIKRNYLFPSSWTQRCGIQFPAPGLGDVFGIIENDLDDLGLFDPLGGQIDKLHVAHYFAW